jgi:hypothetical protein
MPSVYRFWGNCWILPERGMAGLAWPGRHHRAKHRVSIKVLVIAGKLKTTLFFAATLLDPGAVPGQAEDLR